MLRLQDCLFVWISHQPAITGFVIFAAGALYGLLGFRLLRFMLTLASAGVGGLLGFLIAEHLYLPPAVPAAMGALLIGTVGGLWRMPAMLVTSTAVSGILGAYLAAQFGLRGTAEWIGLAVAGVTGLVLSIISQRAMAVFVTTLLGAGLVVVGFVGVVNTLVPSFGSTFRVCARNQSLLIPIMLVLVATTLYSCQTRSQQGDIRTGM